jgi:hypothetical protein
MMSFQPSVLEIHLPEWVDSFLIGYPEYVAPIQERTSLVIEAAHLNVSKATRGPFADKVQFQQPERIRPKTSTLHDMLPQKHNSTNENHYISLYAPFATLQVEQKPLFYAYSPIT